MESTVQSLQTDVRNFIVNNFLFGEDDPSITEDTSLLQSGVIDSTGVLELVNFIEETYSISVDDDDLVPENLDSISNVARYVEKKRCA